MRIALKLKADGGRSSGRGRGSGDGDGASPARTRTPARLRPGIRLPLVGALGLLSSINRGSATAAAGADLATRSPLRLDIDSLATRSADRPRRREVGLDSIKEPIDGLGRRNCAGGGIYDIGASGGGAAFVSAPRSGFALAKNFKKTKAENAGRIKVGSETAASMKRASPAAFAATAFKRSLSAGPASVLASSSPAGAEVGAADLADAMANGNRPPLRNFRSSFDHSWTSRLSPESPENFEKSTSSRLGRGASRPVYNGHYVAVRPTPLKNPRLVIHSPELLSDLGFREDEAHTEAFAKYFSGDVDGAFADTDASDSEDEGDEGTRKEKEIETWATPYALSIMGRRMTSNCPFGTGDGYGDGRAISVGEVLVPKSDLKAGANSNNGDGQAALDKPYPDRSRYELQLKGAGQTPFCRGADGRAVLRSSIREFLASEAMHHLGVSTTRALSLVASEGPDGDTSGRPWYSDRAKSGGSRVPRMDDPRLARFSEEQRRAVIRSLEAQAKSDPDMMVEERCAITTRVAPSFVRIGHLDLFARRVEALPIESGDAIRATDQYGELEDMMWHTCYREFYLTAYEPYFKEKDAKGAALALLDGALEGISRTVGGWVRVGFVQGNFNADNCLVAGRTMDYGPFGFVDVYHPLAAKWTGSGEHFGFMNQPNAGYANFAVLVESLLPIIDANGGNVDEVRDKYLKKAQAAFSDSLDEAIRAKMGLEGGPPDVVGEEADELWGEAEQLLRMARGDWTVFWRQLTYVAAKHPPAKEGGADCSEEDYDAMTTTLLGEGDVYPFYEPLTEEGRVSLRAWIERWHVALTKCHRHASGKSKEAVSPGKRMRQSNPKYTLREWMLVDAYTRADPGRPPGSPTSVPGDYSGVRELFELIRDPYGEGTPEQHEKYYRRTPDEALKAGGTAFMS